MLLLAAKSSLVVSIIFEEVLPGKALANTRHLVISFVKDRHPDWSKLIFFIFLSLNRLSLGRSFAFSHSGCFSSSRLPLSRFQFFGFFLVFIVLFRCTRAGLSYLLSLLLPFFSPIVSGANLFHLKLFSQLLQP